MLGSNCTVEDYSAWRRERVEEAADLARCLNYLPRPLWERIQGLYTEAPCCRSDEGQSGLSGWFGQALHTAWARLVHLAP